MKRNLSHAIPVERHFPQEAAYINTVCYPQVYSMHLEIKEYKITTKYIGNFPQK